MNSYKGEEVGWVKSKVSHPPRFGRVKEKGLSNGGKKGGTCLVIPLYW